MVAEPKLYALIISSVSSPFPELGMRGIKAKISGEIVPISGWDKGCVIALQWQRDARSLIDLVKPIVGEGYEITALQIGSDVAQLGFESRNRSFGKVQWMRKSEDRSS